MGIYTEKFRELTDDIPSTPDKFPDPIHASQWTARMRNAALQIIATLEEELEDAQEEKLKLENRLMENTVAGSSDKNIPEGGQFWDKWKT